MFFTQFVSSFGIASSVKNYPFTLTKNGATYRFNFDNVSGMSVYVRITDVINFFNNCLNRFKNPIILVTGDMDTTVPDDIMEIYHYLDHPKLLKWYAQNYSGNYKHPKLYNLPIGLDYHTLYLSTNSEWGESGTPSEQETALIEIKNNFKNIVNCNGHLAVTNFQHSTIGYPLRRQHYREPILNALKNKECIVWLPKQTRINFWNSCNDNAFVICPFGNGLDTHRTWEVLILGRIPIIPKSNMNIMFEGLPVIEVGDLEWKDINSEWLVEKFNNIKLNWDTYSWDKLNLSYWINQIV